MTNVKVNGLVYPAEIFGRVRDTGWDGRAGTLTCKMGKPTADELLAVLMGGTE